MTGPGVIGRGFARVFGGAGRPAAGAAAAAGVAAGDDAVRVGRASAGHGALAVGAALGGLAIVGLGAYLLWPRSDDRARDARGSGGASDAAGGASVVGGGGSERPDRPVPAPAPPGVDGVAEVPSEPVVEAPAPPPAPPIQTVPGSHFAQGLVREAPTAPVSATRPEDFMAMHAADGPGWAAADGTFSMQLPDGKQLWVYGDTMMNTVGPGGELRRNSAFVRNSAILQDGTRTQTLVTGTAEAPGDFLKPDNPNEWYWPGAGVAEGDELLMFMGKVRKTADGPPGWNFEGAGSDLVRMDLRDLSVKERIPLPGGDNMNWGVAITHDDEYTYVFGQQGVPKSDEHPWGQSLAHVARARKGELGDMQWKYWDGTGWNADPGASKAVADGVSPTYSVLPTPDGRWAMVSQEGFFSPKLLARTADSPKGPWGPWRVIDQGPPVGEKQITYNALVHPQFDDQGKMLVSWNMNLQSATLPTPEQNHMYRAQFKAVDASTLNRHPGD